MPVRTIVRLIRKNLTIQPREAVKFKDTLVRDFITLISVFDTVGCKVKRKLLCIYSLQADIRHSVSLQSDENASQSLFISQLGNSSFACSCAHMNCHELRETHSRINVRDLVQSVISIAIFCTVVLHNGIPTSLPLPSARCLCRSLGHLTHLRRRHDQDSQMLALSPLEYAHRQRTPTDRRADRRDQRTLQRQAGWARSYGL